MPAVKFYIGSKEIGHLKSFPPPKKVTELFKGWYRAAMRAHSDVPMVPQINGQVGEWGCTHQDVTDKYICFTLQNQIGERARVLIIRDYDNIGQRT